MGELDSILTFSPAGQALRGAGNFAYDTLMMILRTAAGLGNQALDAVGYAANAVSPTRSVLTGQAFAYQPQSALMQSVQQQGVLGTLGTGITGVVRNAPGIGLIGALAAPNRDWGNIGGQVVNTGMAGVGAAASMRAGSSVNNVSVLEATTRKGGWPATGGAGPVPGTIGITNQTSVGALKNYNPKGGGVEFVYDPRSSTFVAGRPAAGLFDGSPHQQLAQSIGIVDQPIVGGTMQRGANGEFYFTENSGHFGQNWTNTNRQQFTDWFSQRVGSPVTHNPWSGR